MHLQEFIVFKLRKEEESVEMIKYDQYFHQRQIFIKMAKHLLIILRMDESNQTHMDKLRSVVLIVDDHIRISVPDINEEDYLPPVTELEDDEYEEIPGDDDPPEHPSDDKYVYDTEDGIPYQDKKQLGWKILAVW